MILLPLVTPHLNFPQTATEANINWYGEKVGEDNYILRCTPGLRLFGALEGSGGIRGLHAMLSVTERLFAVRGASFQEWTGSAWVERGRLDSLSGIVGMQNNTNQMLIVDGDKGYGYTVEDTESFAPIVNFPGGNAQAQYLSLRLLSVKPNSGFFYASDQDDVFTWNALNRAEAEDFPDNLLTVTAVGGQLLLLSAGSYQWWVTSNVAGFPFKPTQQANGNIGCSAPATVQAFGNSVYFLGGSAEGRGIVYKTAGYTMQPISDTRIEEMIYSYGDISDAVGFVYQEQGHVFYQLSFPTGNATLTYDLTTNLWAERNYRELVSGELVRRPEIVQAFYQGKNLVGDFRNGNIYQMSRSFFTDDGNPVIRDKYFSIWPEEQIARVHVPPLAIFMDMGKTISGQEAPKPILNISDDRGETFGTDLYGQMSTAGFYERRIVYHSQGSSYGRVNRIRVTGDQDFVFRRAGYLNEFQAV